MMLVNAAHTPQPKNGSAGFLLIEVMVAILVLSIGVLAQLSMQVKSIHSNAAALRMTQRTTYRPPFVPTSIRIESIPSSGPAFHVPDCEP